METSNYIVTAYWIYILVFSALAVAVAQSIHKNIRAFLSEIFVDHDKVAIAVNNLLLTGFYLIAFGFGFLRLHIAGASYNEHVFMSTQKELVEVLAAKLGAYTLFVGFLLFFELFLMLGLRKGAKQNRLNEERTRLWAQQQQQQYVQAQGLRK